MVATHLRSLDSSTWCQNAARSRTAVTAIDQLHIYRAQSSLWRNPSRTQAPGPVPRVTPELEQPADIKKELQLNCEKHDIPMEVDNTVGRHKCGRAKYEVTSMAVIAINFPQRSMPPQSYREGTPEGAAKRLVEIQTLATEIYSIRSPHPESKCLRPTSPGSKRRRTV